MEIETAKGFVEWKKQKNSVHIDTAMVSDFLAGDHDKVASAILNRYAAQAYSQIEDRDEASAEIENRAKREVFLLASEAEKICLTGAEIAVNGEPSKAFTDRIARYVTARTKHLFCVINDMLLNS